MNAAIEATRAVNQIERVLSAAANTGIASAAEALSAASEEVSRNVTSIKDNAPKSALYAEETSKAGLKLQNMAVAISDIMSEYKSDNFRQNSTRSGSQ